MAQTIITRQHLCNVIGLATDDEANAIISKGTGALEYFAQFQPADINNLCSSVRKPGVKLNYLTRPTQTGIGAFQNRDITLLPYVRQELC